MHPPHRFPEGRPGKCRLAQFGYPLGKRRQGIEHLPHYFVERLGGQSLRQLIDRLDQRQAVELVRFDDEVRVRDLLFAVEETDLTGDVALFADRQGVFDPATLRPEEHQLDIAGLVVGKYPVRHMRLTTRWGLVPVNMQLQGCDMADIGIGNAVHAAPVDGADGHVHEHIESNGVLPLRDAKKTRHQGAELRPYAFDGMERTKQWVERRRPGHAFW